MGTPTAEPIVVVARWQTTPEHLGPVLGHVAALREQSLAEPGCLGYEVFQSTAEPGSLLLLERYRDEAALDAHRQSPHFRERVLEHIVPMLSSRQVELLQARSQM